MPEQGCAWPPPSQLPPTSRPDFLPWVGDKESLTSAPLGQSSPQMCMEVSFPDWNWPARLQVVRERYV